MRIPSLASVFSTVSAIALLLPGCDSSADKKAALAKLSNACRINSDCGAPLICVFERCHEECETSRDCAAESRCVQGPQSRNVCQLPDEQACSATGACPGDQVCGVDAECRDACNGSRECLSEQVCSSGTCADVSEVNGDGKLDPAPERPATAFTPCAFDSDCPGRQVCAAGQCRVECEDDVQCGLAERCVERACEPLAAPEPCLRNSDCAADQVCRAGRCQTVPPQPEAACLFDSDCELAGQRCTQGQCVCECRTEGDCPRGHTCRDECSCVASRVIEGDVRIQNDRDLELLHDVVEVTGRLELQLAGAREYRLPNLRRVGSFIFSGSGGSVWLEALEESPGAVQCFQECYLPRLRSAGDLALSSNSFRSISLPRLEAVTRSLHVYYCGNLSELTLPKLTRVQGLRVHGALRLTKLELPLLESLESLSVGGNERLETVSLPLAEPTEAVEISNSASLSSLSLPAVTSLASGLSMWGNSKLETVELAALEQARTIDVQTMPSLRSLRLPALTRVDQTFFIASTSGPSVLDLPNVTHIGQLTLSATSGLESIAAPELLTMNALVVANADIQSVELPLRSLTDQLSLSNAPQLSTLKLGTLESAGQISLSGLPALASMDLSSLETAGNMVITETGLESLASLYFDAGGALRSAGDLQITLNPALPVCAISTLGSKLVSQGWDGNVFAQDNLQCVCEGAVCQ